MEKDATVASMLHETKRGSGKRWVFMAITVVVFAAVIAVVVVGFWGRNIQENSEAMSGGLGTSVTDARRP